MDRALDEHPIADEGLRAFLRQRLHELADHMRNQDG
jgi:truncated hemoglobin YjbI